MHEAHRSPDPEADWNRLAPVLDEAMHDTTDFVTAVFLASVLKGVLLHYTGLKGYRRALPFFLGLMLGDLVMGVTWVVIGILLNTPTYRFFM